MNIFFAALDWGFGHTTRIVPVISQYKEKGHKIIIGCSGNQKEIFSQHFQEVLFLEFNSISPRLNKSGKHFFLWIVFTVQFFFFFMLEKKRTRKILSEYQIDLIISDNRYGVRSGNCHSILITHQLNLILPKPFNFFRKPINRWIHNQINRFDTCLVPDYDSEIRIAGNLSKRFSGCRTRLEYIGPQSRLNLVEPVKTSKKDILIIISGPEKQRSVFEQIVLKQLPKIENKFSYILLVGKQGSQNINSNILNNPEPGKVKFLIEHAKYIICRSGYSTIMDLISMNKTAYIIPTPGQSEQEYIAKYLNEKGLFVTGQQKSFNLAQALDQLSCFVSKPRPIPDEWVQKSNGSFSI